MSDWKEQIEAQIALYSMGGNCLPDVCEVRKADCCPCTATARTLKALLDVAVAADAVSKCKGQTLLGCAPDNDYPNVPEDEQSAHMYGAYKAFNQCAGIVNPALDKLREERNEAVMKMQGCELEIERLRSALESIAKNTCCDKCQEAALVARDALKERDDE